MKEALMLCVFSGLCFAAAPLIAGPTKVNAWMMGFLVASGTIIAFLPLLPRLQPSALTAKGALICLVAGAINGLGLVLYYRLVAGGGQGLWETSKVLPILFILVPVFVVLGSRAVYGEPVTPRKLLGLAFAGVAIWFLR